MIIDIHTHAWPEKVSGKARENLERIFGEKMVCDPTVPNLLKYMDKNGVDVSVICAVATRPAQVPAINDWLFGTRSGRLKVFCAMHPAYDNWKDELKRIKDRGDGIKFQPEFQDFYVDDVQLMPIYGEMERLDIPVLFHCGEELSGTMKVRSSPSRISKVKERFPRLKIIGAHFGGFRLWDEVKEHLLGKDIYLDTSFFFGFLPDVEAKQLLLEHRPDRLIFGTDFPLVDQKKDLGFLRELDISEELKEKILFRNAQLLLYKPA
ncbi:MAG: amidohydrolase family protein [Candidatus Omnitrophica bacterium]|nr:amidohydrolase family protein [Candidatus Omnitrophota bacterium]